MEPMLNKQLGKSKKMANRVDVDISPPYFLEINNGRTAQCYTKIDRGSSEQAGER